MRGAAAFGNRTVRSTAKKFLPWGRQAELLQSLPGIRMRTEEERAFSQVIFCSNSPWSKDHLGRIETSIWLGGHGVSRLTVNCSDGLQEETGAQEGKY